MVDGFNDPARLIDRFRDSARRLIADGADVIIPGEMPLNVLLATEGVHEVDGAPVLDGLGVTFALTECFVDLKRRTRLGASRNGWYGAAPRKERVQEVLGFYGLDRLGEK